MSYYARAYTRTPVPSAYELHVMKRLGTGFSRSTFASVRAMGVDAWLARQLSPSSVPESSMATQVDSWFPDLWQTPKQKWTANQDGTKGGWEYQHDFACWTILRRIYSARPVLETMVDFWNNHLHVSTGHDLTYVHQVAYDRMLRSYALGRFEDLLVAASTHPAMSLYLDNWLSRRDEVNENQGRELLELHTVGVGHYTEDMVKDSAKLLSGFSVDWDWDGRATFEKLYDVENHTTGAVTVLGFHHANSARDGRAAGLAYLKYLAHHPLTAANVARRLATRFVSDTPSAALVSHLSSVFLSSGTDIRATLQALVAHPDFRASVDRKMSTPVDDLVATVRSLGIVARKPTRDDSFARALDWTHGGLSPHSWPTPDGPPETGAEWTTAVRMIRSWQMHWNLGAGWWPRTDASFLDPRRRLPATRIYFDLLVDHLSRSMLGRPSSSRLLMAACQATGVTPRTVVSAGHPVVGWMWPHLVGVLLDNPHHMTR